MTSHIHFPTKHLLSFDDVLHRAITVPEFRNGSLCQKRPNNQESYFRDPMRRIVMSRVSDGGSVSMRHATGAGGNLKSYL
jgi:hypothetical protein